ncbi:DUF998 domain-containing protein [Sphaerisporangium perillae]|uniref:DUF998 domain-containing protein n=1 Tax=Sphaerisporangium perillae TaxID=2935860 RepID=UPI00200F1FF9|nr:DUF998 domain-containing protein [Sphaerisporangium perillae]
MLKRLYPLAAGVGMLVASITMAAGLIGTSPGILDVTIGRYAVLDHGGATEFVLAVLGLASLGLLAGMRAVRAPLAGWPERLVVAWAVSLMGAAAVPHAGLADLLVAVALISLAGAAALMVRRFGDDERWKPAARPMEWLALGSGGGLAVLTYVALPGHQVMIGLVEWALLGVEATALAASAVQLMRIALPARARMATIIAMAGTMENATTSARNTTPVLSRH